MDDVIVLDLGGRSVSVMVIHSARARRLALRLDPAKGPVVTVPPRVSPSQTMDFLIRHRIWLAERLARLPGPVRLMPGQRVPLLGVSHLIVHCPDARRGVWLDCGEIRVSGVVEHVERRVRDFLMTQARQIIPLKARSLAGMAGRNVARITVKDTKSRWGSCSSQGNLAFSWRLVLAPETVLDYVVAHEVSHLFQMNHSAAFWRMVGTLCPHWQESRRWLKLNGHSLHGYGLDALQSFGLPSTMA